MMRGVAWFATVKRSVPAELRQRAEVVGGGNVRWL